MYIVQAVSVHTYDVCIAYLLWQSYIMNRHICTNVNSEIK